MAEAWIPDYPGLPKGESDDVRRIVELFIPRELSQPVVDELSTLENTAQANALKVERKETHESDPNLYLGVGSEISMTVIETMLRGISQAMGRFSQRTSPIW